MELEKEKVVVWNIKGNILFNIICGIDVVMLYLIVEWYEDSKLVSSLWVVDWMEFVVCVFGIVIVGILWVGCNVEV